MGVCSKNIGCKGKGKGIGTGNSVCLVGDVKVKYGNYLGS